MTNWLSWLQSYLFKFDKHIVHAKFKWDSICICPSQFNTVLFFSRNKFPQDTSEGTILPKRHTNYDESSCNKLEISFKIIRIMLKGTAERRECRIDPSTEETQTDTLHPCVWNMSYSCGTSSKLYWYLDRLVPALVACRKRPRNKDIKDIMAAQRFAYEGSCIFSDRASLLRW